MGQRGVRAVEQPENVDAHHPLPLLDWRIDNRSEQHHARVVDQCVEASKLGDCLLHRPIRFGLIGDVGGDHRRRGAVRPKPLGQVLESIRTARDQGHAGTQAGE